MASRDYGSPPLLASAGKQTNAADQVVHADTDQLVAGLYEVRVIAGGSVAALWQIQRRNAGNTASVTPSPYTVYTPAGQSGEYVLMIELAVNERVRVTNDGAITGTTAATIQVEALT